MLNPWIVQWKLNVPRVGNATTWVPLEKSATLLGAPLVVKVTLCVVLEILLNVTLLPAVTVSDVGLN